MNDFLKKEGTKVNSFTGNIGQIIMADTTGFHRGGYCEEGSRLMLTLVFYPKTEPHKSRIKIYDPLENISLFQRSNLSVRSILK